MNDDFTRRLHAELPQRLQALKIPGAALALIEGGRIAGLHCWGVADRNSGAPVSELTAFRLASISKSFTAWAVMVLVERGQVDLDAPVWRHLTRWRLPPSPRDADGVTVRRLLTHTAGVSSAGLGFGPPGPGPSLIDALEQRVPPPPPDWEAYRQRWKLPHDAPATLAWPPGEGFHYSNAGFALLELIVEEVSGQGFAEFVAQAVLQPLGLHNAAFTPPPGAATGHSESGHAITPMRPLGQAAGGLCASIRDLATFACAVMPGPGGEPPGRGVLQPASVDAMFRSHGFAEHDEGSGMDFEAGLGHLLCRIGGALNVHHSGGFVGWRSIWSAFPEAGAGFCMLINSDAGNELWQPLIQDWGRALAG